MAELPVDPEKKHDTFYRYKMPPVQIKVEGSGNGIKTVLPNIEEIARRISRDVEYPIKYFGSDLGAHAKCEDTKWIIMGQHAKDRLQKSLYDYICKFVLCKACRNPETKTIVDDKKNIMLRCGACGKDTSIDQKEKIANLILRKETPTLSRAKDLQKEKEKKEKKKEKKNKEKEDKERRGSTVDEVSPVDIFRQFMEEEHEDSEVVIRVREMKTEYSFKDKDIARLATEVLLCGEDVVKNIRKWGPGVMRTLILEDCQKYVIERLEVAVFEDFKLCDQFPIALWALYDESIIDEDPIIAWFRKEKVSKSVDPERVTELKEKTKPFVDWLLQDEDGDD